MFGGPTHLEVLRHLERDIVEMSQAGGAAAKASLLYGGLEATCGGTLQQDERSRAKFGRTQRATCAKQNGCNALISVAPTDESPAVLAVAMRAWPLAFECIE